MTYGFPAPPPRPDPGSSWWQRRVAAPVVQQLKQGITPERVALTLALGGVIGIFPILGATTFLCAIVGVWLRLNQPLIQLVNYLVYAPQLLLLIPFYRAGEKLFGAEPVPIVDVPGLIARFGADPWQFLLDYGKVGLYGIAVWCLVAPVIAGVAYLMLKPVLVSAGRRLQTGKTQAR